MSQRRDASCQIEEATEDKVPTKQQWFQGIGDDIRIRLPLYFSDWTIESPKVARKIVAATLFAYFTSVLPAVIFGDQLQIATNNAYGLPEVLVSTGALGILYSVCAGQGLVIVRRGPSMLILSILKD